MTIYEARDNGQTMTQQRTETVRRAFEAFSEQDINVWLACWHPDGEWYPAMGGQIEAERHRGHGELRRFAEDSYATWETIRLIADEITEVGDRILVVGRVRARGSGSGVELERPWAWVTEFQGDKFIRVRAYLDRVAALEEVGLRT
jgi:ketosteroid isomerase-like protein